MVEITKKTPRVDTTIDKVTAKVPAPYAEGHTLNANEASALNQTYRENIRNNIASKRKAAIKAEAEAAEKEKRDPRPAEEIFDVQAQVDAYVKEYEFGAGGGGTRLDPVEKQARELAWEKVKEALKKQGHKISDVSTEQKNRFVDDALKKYPQITEQAKQMVEIAEGVGKETLDLDLS